MSNLTLSDNMENQDLENISTTDVPSRNENIEAEPVPSGHISSPLESAVVIGKEDHGKPLYKNDDYFDEIRIIFAENVAEDPVSCFYVSVSFLMFRMVNSDSVKFLRKKFAYLVNYQRLITACEPELTMERLAVAATMNKMKELPEHLVSFKTLVQKFPKWEDLALHGGATRIFTCLLSYALNKPVYVLDLSTNQWREYDLSNTNLVQSQFHTDFAQEFLPLHPLGPPFMLAEHLEMQDGQLLTTHVAPIMHEDFFDGSVRAALPFKYYISFMTHPKMKVADYNFVFASSYNYRHSSNFDGQSDGSDFTDDSDYTDNSNGSVDSDANN